MRKILSIWLAIGMLFLGNFIGNSYSQPIFNEVTEAILKKADTFYEKNNYGQAYKLYLQLRDDRRWYDGVSLYRLAYSNYMANGETPTVFFDYATALSVLGVDNPSHKYVDAAKKKLASFKAHTKLGKNIVSSIDATIATKGSKNAKARKLLELLLPLPWRDDSGKVTSFTQWEYGDHEPGTIHVEYSDPYVHCFLWPLQAMFIGQFYLFDVGDATTSERLIEDAMKANLPERVYTFLDGYPDDSLISKEFTSKIINWSIGKLGGMGVAYPVDDFMGGALQRLEDSVLYYYKDIDSSTLHNYLQLEEKFPDVAPKNGLRAFQGFDQASNLPSMGSADRQRLFKALGIVIAGARIETARFLETLRPTNGSQVEDLLRLRARTMDFIHTLSVISTRESSEGKKRLDSFYSQVATASDSQKPWETQKEYQERLSQAKNSIPSMLDQDRATLDDVINQAFGEILNVLGDRAQEITKTITSNTYTISDPAIRVSIGEFDRESKSWPISVSSRVPEFSYTTQFSYTIAGKPDIEYLYSTFVRAAKANDLIPVLKYTYQEDKDHRFLVATIKNVEIIGKSDGSLFCTGGNPQAVFGVWLDQSQKHFSLPTLTFLCPIPDTQIVRVVEDGDNVVKEKIGICPLTIPVSPGVKLGFIFVWNACSEYREVILVPGQNQTLRAGDDVGFVKITGLEERESLKIDYDFYNYENFGNGKALAMKAGPHTFWVDADGTNLEWTKKVDVFPGATLSLDISRTTISIPMDKVSNGISGFSMVLRDTDSPHNLDLDTLVYLRNFYMSRYEITQEQYVKVMGKNPSMFSMNPDSASCPVEQVSWYDAVLFCNKLSIEDGLQPVYFLENAVTINSQADGYRLPTQAEWQFAARGGVLSQKYIYPGSDNVDFVAWYSRNSEDSTHCVGKLLPNELGLFDMGGNVAEWCWDDYPGFQSSSWKEDFSHSGNREWINPASNDEGELGQYGKVVMGGSCYDEGEYTRSTYRSYASPGMRSTTIGIRLVRYDRMMIDQAMK